MGVQLRVLHKDFLSGQIHGIVPGHHISAGAIPADPVSDRVQELRDLGPISGRQDDPTGLVQKGLSLALMEKFKFKPIPQIADPFQLTTWTDPGTGFSPIQAVSVEQVINFTDQPGIHTKVQAILACKHFGLPPGRQAIEIIDIGRGGHLIAEPGIFHAEKMVGGSEPIQACLCSAAVLEQVIKDFCGTLTRTDDRYSFFLPQIGFPG